MKVTCPSLVVRDVPGSEEDGPLEHHLRGDKIIIYSTFCHDVNDEGKRAGIPSEDHPRED